MAELSRDRASVRLGFSVLPELADSQRARGPGEPRRGRGSVSDGSLPGRVVPGLGSPAGEFGERPWGRGLGLDLEISLGSVFLPCESICLNF